MEELIHGVSDALGLATRVVRTDGTQPVGHGIGPALEARDALAVLQRAPNAPSDLRQRALLLAGHVLELGGAAALGAGCERARQTLDSGAALSKFEAICVAQGGLRTPPRAPFVNALRATRQGRIGAIDNRRLARVAKLAGAPRAAAAGLELHVKIGDAVTPEQPLITLHAETPGELDYASRYLQANPDVIALAEG